MQAAKIDVVLGGFGYNHAVVELLIRGLSFDELRHFLGLKGTVRRKVLLGRSLKLRGQLEQLSAP